MAKETPSRKAPGGGKGKKGKGEDAEDEQDLERILEDVCHRILGRLAKPDLTQCGQ